MTAAEKILKRCDERHWDLPALAKASGLNYTTLRNYVGKSPRTPPVDNAIRIARALEVDVAWLYDADRDCPPQKQQSAATRSGMKWQEKITRLLAGKNASSLARSVGLHVGAITAAVSSGHIPIANKALRIARALNVPTDWLFDDEQPWPPPPPQRSPTRDIATPDLVNELARRRNDLCRDMASIAARVPDRTLEELEELAAMQELTPTEKKRLTVGVHDLWWLTVLSQQLHCLQVHPSPAKSVTEIVAPYPALHGTLYDSLTLGNHKTGDAAPSRKAGTP